MKYLHPVQEEIQDLPEGKHWVLSVGQQFQLEGLEQLLMSGQKQYQASANLLVYASIKKY